MSQERRLEWSKCQQRHEEELSGWMGPLNMSLLDYLYTIRAVSLKELGPRTSENISPQTPKKIRKTRTFSDISPIRFKIDFEVEECEDLDESDLSGEWSGLEINNSVDSEEWSGLEINDSLELHVVERSDSIGEIILPDESPKQTNRPRWTLQQDIFLKKLEKLNQDTGSLKERRFLRPLAKTQSDGDCLKKLQELHFIEEAIERNEQVL